MPQSILLPKDNSIIFHLIFYLKINTSYNAPWWLPCHKWKELLLTFFTYWLNQSILFWITLCRTNKSSHHLVFCYCFITIYSLIIDDKMCPISSPAESRQSKQYFLTLIKRDLIHKIKLFIKLNDRLVIGNNIQILLSWRNSSSKNTIFILCLNIYIPICIHSENASITWYAKYLLLIHQPLYQ